MNEAAPAAAAAATPTTNTRKLNPSPHVSMEPP
jgi:hypothetical protein